MTAQLNFGTNQVEYLSKDTPRFPSLKGSKVISIDVETCDPNLTSKGPGDIRRDGYLVGVSIATDDFCQYYPIRHHGGGNFSEDSVLSWLRDELKGPEPKVGASIAYDLGWLHTEGIVVGGRKYDIQITEALLDENQASYSLDTLIGKYFPGEGKYENVLRVAANRLGFTKEGDIKANLWRLHAADVAEYGEQDARGTLRVHNAHAPHVADADLGRVLDLESRLVDVLHKTRLRGIKVDVEQAQRSINIIALERTRILGELRNVSGVEIDIWSAASISRAFDQLNIPYSRTEKGNPSFTAELLEKSLDPLSRTILSARQLDRAGEVFIKSKILSLSHNGRLHPNYRQTRVEEGGTRSGRLSSNKPNFQQFPARNPILSKAIRSCLIPDEGFSWGVFDYSQQEPRVTVHYAYLRKYPGAAEVRQSYINDPTVDYHQLVADMTEKITGVNIGRKNAKTLNLGLVYGMGVYKIVSSLNLPEDDAMKIYRAYHKSVPYVKMLSEEAMRQAKRRGWIKTVLGRRSHFPEGLDAYKALNRAVQGSSADMIKKAMVDLDDAGYDMYGTVHDELDLPILLGNDRQIEDIREIMINTITLEVPLVVDVEIGPSWGGVEKWQKG